VSKRQWDLTSTNSVRGAAEWLRKRSDALFVLIVRPNDVVIDHDPRMEPMDIINTLRNEMPALLQYLIDQRAKRKEKHQQLRGGAQYGEQAGE